MRTEAAPVVRRAGLRADDFAVGVDGVVGRHPPWERRVVKVSHRLPLVRFAHGRLLDWFSGSRGRPSTRSPRMLCWISSVPPAIDCAGTDTSTSATAPPAGE